VFLFAAKKRRSGSPKPEGRERVKIWLKGRCEREKSSSLRKREKRKKPNDCCGKSKTAYLQQRGERGKK